MKQAHSLRKSEAGVIHHLGLIVFAVALVGVIAFAVYRIQGGDPNFGYDGADSSESADDEDATQAELDTATDETDASASDSDQEQVATDKITEENDAIN